MEGQLILCLFLISLATCAVIQPRGDASSTVAPWSSQSDSSGERVRRQYPYGLGNYGMYGGYGGYGGYGNYAGYGGYPVS